MAPAGAAAVAAHVRRQAGWCADLGSPLYAALLARAADDVDAGGPVAEALADHEGDPDDDALALRLAGTVHRLVLAREAPALALHYPSVGGTPGPPEQVWGAFRDVVAQRLPAVRAGLASAPQTNEVGRSAPLLGGLRHLAARAPLPVRLVEVGSSAGLNLRPDLVRVQGDDGWEGPRASPVALPGAWRGPVPRAGVRVVERRGSDVAPVDPATTQGRLRLTAYVWPDMAERLARLRGALELARRAPARLERSGAAAAVSALRPAEGAWTVVHHSVVRQYLPPAERDALDAALEALGGAASPASPVAHLALEPEGGRFVVRLRTWPDGDDAVLGTAAPHGVPVRWGDG
ncbi:DUF2332 domain-containing protein [Vallicoccus soli]|uniref:DUF2332 domain-containing protein n=1 Tax=Vallicoccus soli TaxID=2339232 RepID=A0A3A3Z3R2_9ACTN|nr:DUF2332 domain-containing protein [Vallicoccus soli]RJK98054.1 DUF2332 domain-containing protein [Vallicoccus soli]